MNIVPERLKASASALRAALNDGNLDTIHIWYVHNCPRSANVEGELKAVAQTVNAIIKTQFPEPHINISADEISAETLERLYTDTSTPILVNDPNSFVTENSFEFKEGDWNCFVTPIKLQLLKDLYGRYNTNLFSANVRDFLGMKAGESNINFQMRRSLSDRPENFFVYNNGLTILTHKIEQEQKGKSVNVTVNGFSIVNGAQTTGTIGTSTNVPPDNAYVLARFISTTSEDLVADVVRYNNSQNAVTASDFRSTDPIQRRLVQEMRSIPDAEYDGGRRGGVSAAIKRRPKLLPSYSVGQAIAAVHGDPTVSYNEKSALWSKDNLYSKYFNDDLSASHIVFCYSLLRAIEAEKADLRTRDSTENINLTASDKAKLDFYRRRGSVFLMAAAIGECMETISNKVITNRFSLSFGQSVSPEIGTLIWAPTVSAVSNLHTQLGNAFSDGLKNSERVSEVVTAFSQLVASFKSLYEPTFAEVRQKLIIQ